jgi:hypothetical protein
VLEKPFDLSDFVRMLDALVDPARQGGVPPAKTRVDKAS